MRDTAISTFHLGQLEAGMAVEVVLATSASMRLIPDGEGAVHLSTDEDAGNLPTRQAIRYLKVPHSGTWRLLVEHVDAARKGGCAIRLLKPAPKPVSLSLDCLGG